MELNSIIVCCVLIVLQVICLSSLPLGRLLLQVLWKMKLMTTVLVVVNFVVWGLMIHYWGLTAHVVIEVIGTALGLALLVRGNPAVEKGLKIILNEPKVEVQD